MSNHKEIANLFQEHREELGFVNTAQVKEKTTYTVYEDGKLVGAALCNHCVQKPQTTLYDIAVRQSARRTGIGTSLIEKMADDSPHDVIVAKCPVDLAATSFYESTGWDQVNTEVKEEKRDLNVYEYEVTK